MRHTFVGFGFGAIQAGLFLCEASRSGNFRRLVVAEVQPNVVKALRQSAGRYTVNIAYSDRIEAEQIGPVEIVDPRSAEGLMLLVESVAEAEEIATALPSVRNYISETAGSVHRILAEGLRRKAASDGVPAVVYTAENHNQAAEILETSVMEAIPALEHDRVRSRVRFLNTVIGKVSGVIADPDEIRDRGLIAIAPSETRAFLVEAFNRILISRIDFDSRSGNPVFQRGITTFEEKPNLLPFKEAKLYAHNSTHALAAYIGAVWGALRITDLKTAPGVSEFLKAALSEESGNALIRRHRGFGAIFTREGYRAYATDLLERMFNPYLGDTVDRVGRDPARKLEWDDRLVGTIRVGLQQGVAMRRYAMGAAAAVTQLDPSAFDPHFPLQKLLDPLWHAASPSPEEKQAVVDLLEEGRKNLGLWRDSGFPHLEHFMHQTA